MAVALIICGTFATSCVSYSAHKKAVRQRDKEIIGLKQHRAELKQAKMDLDRENKEFVGRNLELQARLEVASKTTTTMRDLEDNLRNQLIRWAKGHPGIEVGVGGPIIQGEVLFSSGSATLKEKAKDVLSGLAEIIKDNPGYLIRIDGHTDTDPISKSRHKWKTRENMELGAHRALNVWIHMKSQGVDPTSMYIASLGEYFPKEPGNKKKNRRVEILFLKAKASSGGNEGEMSK